MHSTALTYAAAARAICVRLANLNSESIRYDLICVVSYIAHASLTPCAAAISIPILGGLPGNVIPIMT